MTRKEASKRGEVLGRVLLLIFFKPITNQPPTTVPVPLPGKSTARPGGPPPPPLQYSVLPARTLLRLEAGTEPRKLFLSGKDFCLFFSFSRGILFVIRLGGWSHMVGLIMESSKNSLAVWYIFLRRAKAQCSNTQCVSIGAVSPFDSPVTDATAYTEYVCVIRRAMLVDARKRDQLSLLRGRCTV